MKSKKVTLISVLLFGIGFGLNAQTSMYLKKNDGTQMDIDIDSLRKLTFLNSDLQVNKTVAATQSYTLSGLRYLSFKNHQTSISAIESLKVNTLISYPNPVSNELIFEFFSAESSQVNLSIFNLQGQVLFQQTMDSYVGAHKGKINVAQIPDGLYFFSVRCAQNIETRKIIITKM